MVYAFLVAVLSLLGAALPLRFKPGHAPLQVYLSLAAGTLLGAGLFHMLPESSHHLGGSFGLPAAIGVLLVFFLQRYVAPHSHEVATGLCEDDRDSTSSTAAGEVRTPGQHEGSAAPLGEASLRPAIHAGVHDLSCGHEHHTPAAPSLSGLIAILALSIHSFFDGVAIAAATGGGLDGRTILGLSVFLSVLIHKPLDGLSVSVLLLHGGVRRPTLWILQGAYAALVPLGAIAFRLTSGAIGDASVFVGCTLALTGGTFLAIALTDLLPELHFHRHDRNKLSAALLIGVLVMWGTSLLGHGDGHDHSEHVAPIEPHSHDHEPHEPVDKHDH